MSARLRPASRSALRTAGTGPRPNSSGLTPAVVNATNRASGVSPSCAARSAATTMAAAAPSLICDELPAVTVPPARKAGRSPASAAADVSRRGPSSTSRVVSVTCGAPLPPPAPSTLRTGTGTVSSAKRPASIAATARSWLRSAKASCSAREICDAAAWFSATRPVPR